MKTARINARCHVLVTEAEERLLKKEAARFPIAYTSYLRMVVFGQLPAPSDWQPSEAPRKEDITITMTTAEVSYIEERASKDGLSISSYLHRQLFRVKEPSRAAR